LAKSFFKDFSYNFFLFFSFFSNRKNLFNIRAANDLVTARQNFQGGGLVSKPLLRNVAFIVAPPMRKPF
jgi:hypothetical protein